MAERQMALVHARPLSPLEAAYTELGALFGREDAR